MPDAQSYIITIPTATVAVGVRGGGRANNGDIPDPIPVVSTTPIQLVGLVPMIPCDYIDCRATPSYCCESLKVFGNTQLSPTAPYILQAVPKSTYENDLNDFYFDVQLIGTSVTWTIEKCNENANVDTPSGWINVATITNNTFGIYEALTTVSGHSTYTGFTVNWGKIILLLGIGNYRIKFSWHSLGSAYSGCFVSPCFVLRKWNCRVANKTVKFECINAAAIGNCDNSGYVFDLCGMNLFSSIRVGGVFGTNTVPKYDTVFNKWGGNVKGGYIEQVHDEALPKWKFNSLMISKPYHDRLKIYMMMANERRVSDYNIFNVDHNIKQLSIVKAGGYEPTDYNSSLPPQSIVSVEFNSGIQNLFASNCCNLK